MGLRQTAGEIVRIDKDARAAIQLFEDAGMKFHFKLFLCAIFVLYDDQCSLFFTIVRSCLSSQFKSLFYC